MSLSIRTTLQYNLISHCHQKCLKQSCVVNLALFNIMPRIQEINHPPFYSHESSLQPSHNSKMTILFSFLRPKTNPPPFQLDKIVACISTKTLCYIKGFIFKPSLHMYWNLKTWHYVDRSNLHSDSFSKISYSSQV